MNLDFLTLENKTNIIHGVWLQKLVVNRDRRGLLIETLREDWLNVFERPHLQFGQSYFSLTYPGFARDEDRWHVHPKKQVDRFVIIKGNATVALYDWRKDSPTYKMLNLFQMGEINHDNGQYLLLIPTNVLHAFCTVGNEPCYLVSYPNCTYDSREEGRIPFAEAAVKFSDGSDFSWNPIREHFKT